MACALAALLALATGANAGGTRYTGGLLGVRAEVSLNERRGVAALELRGAPVGGSLSGEARFDTRGRVVLDRRLQTALARRFVHVLSVSHSPHGDALTIELRLPIFGARTLCMSPAPPPLQSAARV